MRAIKHCWCGSIAEGQTEMCASHNAESRKAERQAGKVKVVRQIQKVTAKRASQLQEYAKLRIEYLALYPVCEVPECNIKATEIHHMGGRQNEDLLNTDLFMSICPGHHHEITTNSAWAIENGYSVSRTAKQ